MLGYGDLHRRYFRTHSILLFTVGNDDKLGLATERGKELIGEFLEQCSLWEMTILDRRFNGRSLTYALGMARSIKRARKQYAAKSDRPGMAVREDSEDPIEIDPDLGLTLDEQQRVDSRAQEIFRLLPPDIRSGTRQSLQNEDADRRIRSSNGIDFVTCISAIFDPMEVADWKKLEVAAGHFDQRIDRIAARLDTNGWPAPRT